MHVLACPQTAGNRVEERGEAVVRLPRAVCPPTIAIMTLGRLILRERPSSCLTPCLGAWGSELPLLVVMTRKWRDEKHKKMRK